MGKFFDWSVWEIFLMFYSEFCCRGDRREKRGVPDEKYWSWKQSETDDLTASLDSSQNESDEDQIWYKILEIFSSYFLLMKSLKFFLQSLTVSQDVKGPFRIKAQPKNQSEAANLIKCLDSSVELGRLRETYCGLLRSSVTKIIQPEVGNEK